MTVPYRPEADHCIVDVVCYEADEGGNGAGPHMELPNTWNDTFSPETHDFLHGAHVVYTCGEGMVMDDPKGNTA